MCHDPYYYDAMTSITASQLDRCHAHAPMLLASMRSSSMRRDYDLDMILRHTFNHMTLSHDFDITILLID